MICQHYITDAYVPIVKACTHRDHNLRYNKNIWLDLCRDLRKTSELNEIVWPTFVYWISIHLTIICELNTHVYDQ